MKGRGKGKDSRTRSRSVGIESLPLALIRQRERRERSRAQIKAQAQAGDHSKPQVRERLNRPPWTILAPSTLAKLAAARGVRGDVLTIPSTAQPTSAVAAVAVPAKTSDVDDKRAEKKVLFASESAAQCPSSSEQKSVARDDKLFNADIMHSTVNKDDRDRDRGGGGGGDRDLGQQKRDASSAAVSRYCNKVRTRLRNRKAKESAWLPPLDDDPGNTASPLLPLVTSVQQDRVRAWLTALGVVVLDGEGAFYPPVTLHAKSEQAAGAGTGGEATAYSTIGFSAPDLSLQQDRLRNGEILIELALILEVRHVQ
jgi:hypothetical protein